VGGVAALAVDPDEYVAASSAFARVRGDSRQVVSTLAGALDGSSGMGGSDNAGTEWAHGYDEAAAQGLAAAAALSNACGQVSLLLGASGQNHAHADAASTIGGGDSALVMGPVIPPLATPSVPSAAGGSGGGPPGWSLVESLVGYAWPNGHQDQLRAAQTAWHTASESLTAAAAPVPGAVSRLGAQQSPEVPVAVATCQQVGTHLGDLSSVLTQIGGSCGDYAAHLDQAHHEILSELKDLIIQTAAIEAGGAVLAFFTVGLDEIAAQAAVAARIAIVAARIRRIIEVLIEAARAVATAVRGFGSRALEILGKLKPLIEAGAKRATTAMADGGKTVVEKGHQLGAKDSPSGVDGFSTRRLGSSLKTETDSGFFWSGRTLGGVGVGPTETGLGVASDIASSKGGTTLEQLMKDRGIELPPWGDGTDPVVVKAWSNASAHYANGVSGDVRAVVGSSLREGNVWQTVELPRLIDNPNVTRITQIDPETGAERVIFPR